jgi:hypothetical protein
MPLANQRFVEPALERRHDRLKLWRVYAGAGGNDAQPTFVGLAGVPHQLGFRPTESLVLVGLTHGVLVVTAPLALADAQFDDMVVQPSTR